MAKPATVTIFAKVDQAISELRRFHNEVETTAGKIDRIGRNVALGMSRIGSSMTRFVTLPIVAAAGLAVRALAEQEKLLAQTEAAIKSTGGAANVTSRDILGLSRSLEKMSGVEAELIQNAQNVLLTFTKIRNEVGEGNDIFDQASLAVLNLSVALGTDLQSASIMVGKALNDPVAGMLAMTRAGIQFTQAQKDQIKALVEAGDILGAQKIILAELETQFGGSAEAAGNTFAGSLAKVKNMAGEVAENVLRHLMPTLEKLAQSALRVAERFGQMDEQGQKTTLMFVGIAAAAGPVLRILGVLVGILGGTVSAFLALIGVGVALEHKLQGMGSSAGGFVGAVYGIVKGIVDLIDWLKGLGAWLDNVRAKWDAFWGAAAGKNNTKGVVVPIPKTSFPAFHEGGVVPGPRGQEQWALVKGGETILPTHKGGIAFSGAGSNGDGGVTNVYIYPQAILSSENDLLRFILDGIVQARRRGMAV